MSKYRIGIAGPFSGPRGAYGDMIRDCATRVINRLDCRDEFDLLTLDDVASAGRAVEVAEQFLEAKVQAVVGHFNSSCAQAVASIYHHEQVTFVAPASTCVFLPFEGQGYVYRPCPTNLEQVDLVLKACKQSGFDVLTIFKDDSDYAAELHELTIKIGKERGIEIVDGVPVEPANGPRRYWFVGTHVNCLTYYHRFKHVFHDDSSLMFCDDCGIDEFFVKMAATRFESCVVTVPGGFASIFSESLLNVVQFLRSSGEPLGLSESGWRLDWLNG